MTSADVIVSVLFGVWLWMITGLFISIFLEARCGLDMILMCVIAWPIVLAVILYKFGRKFIKRAIYEFNELLDYTREE